MAKGRFLGLTQTNVDQLAVLEEAWLETRGRICVKGFHGRATIEVIVQDGVIQETQSTVKEFHRRPNSRGKRPLQ